MIKYTYFRQNHGSRLDRFYIKDLSNYITNIDVVNVYFSDHLSVIRELKLLNMPKIGRYYWKLNVNYHITKKAKVDLKMNGLKL